MSLRFALIVGLWVSAQALPAQSGGTVALRPLTEEQWERAVDGIDYSDDRAEEEEPPPAEAPDLSKYNLETAWIGQVVQVLAIIGLIGLIGFGIYRMIGRPRNRRLARDGVEITLDNLEEYLDESDLDHFLREALAQQRYSVAVRLYYLQIIKDLSGRGLLRWSREKTNRDYLRELQRHRLFEPFRSATRIYERVWYGNAALDEAAFRRIEPELQRLLSAVRAS
jgi:hypothetical protein